MYNKPKAVMFIILATIFFAFMSFFVKLASEIPSMEKAMFRNLLAAMIMFFVISTKAVKNRGDNTIRESLKVFKPKNPKELFFRSLLGTIGVILNFIAIDRLILADSTILARTSPFFTLIFAHILLGEKIESRMIKSMIISFVGILFVVKPQFDAQFLPYLAGIIGAVAAGVAYVYLRILGTKKEDSNVVVFYFSLFSTITLMPMAIYVHKSMNTYELIVVLVASLCAMFAQMCLTRGYKYAPANEVSVFLNFQVIVTAILGAVFLSEYPDVYSFIGYLIIIGASIWAFNPKKVSQQIEEVK